MELKITVAHSEEEFDRIAAWRIVGQILEKPSAVIGLSTGRTTVNMHRIVAEIFKSQPFDVSRATIFGVDEVAGVPKEYSGACYTMLWTQLVEALGIPDGNFVMPPTLSGDYGKVCADFTAELDRRGGIDLQVLGLGENGHLGFNQPGTPFESETWVSPLLPELEERFRRETGIAEGFMGGITLGLKNIMHSRRIVLVAKGDNKAEAVREMIKGAITIDNPSSILQLHPNCEFILDSKSAKLL